MNTKAKKRKSGSAGRSGTAVKTQKVDQRKTPVKSRSKAPAKAQTKRPPDSQIVYTQPKPFNRNRFLLRLATVAAVVLALLFGMSIFFKVKNVNVSGAEKYTAWEIREASGLQEGENLLTISEAKISARIRTMLPYVYSVRVGIKLPDTVNIEITELDVVYAVESGDGKWWLMDADGKIVDKTTGSAAMGNTRILGVKLDNPVLGEQAVALEPEPETQETGETAVTVPVTVREAERLSTVITILQYLEDNGVIGEVASLDVSDLTRIELWYSDRYQVLLGNTTQLSYKIENMKKAIDQQTKYQSGILDVSFTTWPDQVGFTPFENQS